MKIKYYGVYALVNNPLIIGIRVVCFIVLLVFLYKFNNLDLTIRDRILALYLLFILNEWFILLGINKQFPSHTVTEDTSGREAVLFPVRAKFERTDVTHFIKYLIEQPEVKALLKKIADSYSAPEVSVKKEDLLSEAYVLAKAAHGTYVSNLDFFIAFLLLSEKDTHFLEKHGISRQEIEGLHYWVRNKELVDIKHPFKLLFTGSGVFDFFIFGWETEIKKYALNLTSYVLSKKSPPVFVGRATEYKQLIETLLTPTANNAILVGEPGTGRGTMVSNFTYDSFMGTLGPLSHKKVYKVLVDQLLSGVENTGELEARLNSLISEIEHSGDVAIVFENIENIFGGGGFDIDISGSIFEYLKSGRTPIIGITTPSSYKKNFEGKQTVKDLFKIVRTEEPDDYTALFMVMEKSFELEKGYGAHIGFDAIKEIISLSSSYLPEEFLPGRAVKLMEDVLTSNVLNGNNTIHKEEVEKFVQNKTKIILTEPSSEEKEKLLHLEDEIHKRLIDQEEAVSAIANAMRRLRSGFASKKRPISTFLFLGPTGVGKTESAKALAEIYFGSDDSMIRLDMSEYQNQDSLKRILGSNDNSTSDTKTLIDMVRQKPFSLILLDEFEKAHPRILDVFLQILDEGRLTDDTGRSISFVNTIIIATSNAGSEFIRENLDHQESHENVKHELINYLLMNNTFKPELLNRFDGIIMFKPLSQEDSLAIARILLENSLKKLEEKQIFLSFSEEILQKVLKEGFDKEFGGRNIRRYINTTVEDFLSKQILEESIKPGDHKQLTLDENGNFYVE